MNDSRFGCNYKQSRQQSLMNEDLVCAVGEKIKREQAIHHYVTFSAFPTNFMNFFMKLFLGTAVLEIVCER